MLPFVKTNANNKILNQLIFANCLSFGRSPKLNNRKINHYIFGTRQKFDLFKLYELRYLILKIYPLIHNLFLQERLNAQKKRKWFFQKNFNFQTPNFPMVFQKAKNFYRLKDKFNKTLKKKVFHTLPPRILFATTTDLYSDIVISAAKKCRMPFHVHRWLAGSITAAAFSKNDKEKWSFLLRNSEENFLNAQFQKKFFKQKKNLQNQKKKIDKAQLNRKPTLIIIPDVVNNESILRETNAVGIPALGLVNTNCHFEVAYPVFANDLSFSSVHFFCHFLSTLIFKEFVKHKHKVHTRRKSFRGIKFSKAMKDIFRFQKRNFSEKFLAKRNHWQKSLKKDYQKKIQVLPRKNAKLIRQRIQMDIRKSYRKKIAGLKKWVESYFRTKAFQKKNKKVRKYKFKGQYYIDHFPKARRRIKKQMEYKKKFHLSSQNISKTILPKKLIHVENQKRLKKNQIHFAIKKKILSKMQNVNQLQAYNFPKILKAIRLPENKPRFRFWNQKKFWYAKPTEFSVNLPFWYTFQRFTLKHILQKKFGFTRPPRWKNRQSHVQKKIFGKRSPNQNTFAQKKYRKRWSTKKSKKNLLNESNQKFRKGHIKSK